MSFRPLHPTISLSPSRLWAIGTTRKTPLLTSIQRGLNPRDKKLIKARGEGGWWLNKASPVCNDKRLFVLRHAYSMDDWQSSSHVATGTITLQNAAPLSFPNKCLWLSETFVLSTKMNDSVFTNSLFHSPTSINLWCKFFYMTIPPWKNKNIGHDTQGFPMKIVSFSEERYYKNESAGKSDR